MQVGNLVGICGSDTESEEEKEFKYEWTIETSSEARQCRVAGSQSVESICCILIRSFSFAISNS